MLTIQKLKDMKPGNMFAMRTGYYPELHDEPIRWVACRGLGIHDWAIYYLLDNETPEYISKNGDKVFTQSIIRKLVPCDDEAYWLYRK